jgi:hypothetical protein
MPIKKNKQGVVTLIEPNEGAGLHPKRIPPPPKGWVDDPADAPVKPAKKDK